MKRLSIFWILCVMLILVGCENVKTENPIVDNDSGEVISEEISQIELMDDSELMGDNESSPETFWGDPLYVPTENVEEYEHEKVVLDETKTIVAEYEEGFTRLQSGKQYYNSVYGIKAENKGECDVLIAISKGKHYDYDYEKQEDIEVDWSEYYSLDYYVFGPEKIWRFKLEDYEKENAKLNAQKYGYQNENLLHMSTYDLSKERSYFNEFDMTVLGKTDKDYYYGYGIGYGRQETPYLIESDYDESDYEEEMEISENLYGILISE